MTTYAPGFDACLASQVEAHMADDEGDTLDLIVDADDERDCGDYYDCSNTGMGYA